MISFSQTVRDRAGNVIPTATVTVYDTGTQNLASLFVDALGSQSLPNPTTSDSNGRVAFYIEPATYDFRVVKGNFSNSLTGVQIDTLLASELSANTGATMVGTDDGANLQVRIDAIESDIADLETDLGSYQPLDATLTGLAGVTTAADELIYATGVNTFAMTGLTSAARGLLNDASVADMRTTLELVPGTNVQAYDADLAAIAGLTSAADRLPYFTGSGTAAVATFTGAARDLLDDADAATMRTTLGVAIGSNVQAYDADLAAIAGLTSAADKGIQFTGAGTAATYDLTTAGKDLLDDANAGAQRTTLGATTVGSNLFTLTNPSAITFPKINADNSVTAESAATHRASIGGTTAGQSLFTVTNPSAITFPRVNADNSVTMRTAAELASDIGVGASGWTVVKKSADQTKTSNAALAADSELSFPMLANTKYAIKLSVQFVTSAAPDFKFDLDGPASPTLVQAHGYSIRAGSPSASNFIYAALNTSTAITVTATPERTSLVLWAIVQNGANAGTFSFRWAQNTSDVANTTVYAGSTLEYA